MQPASARAAFNHAGSLRMVGRMNEAMAKLDGAMMARGDGAMVLVPEGLADARSELLPDLRGRLEMERGSVFLERGPLPATVT